MLTIFDFCVAMSAKNHAARFLAGERRELGERSAVEPVPGAELPELGFGVRTVAGRQRWDRMDAYKSASEERLRRSDRGGKNDSWLLAPGR